MIKKYIRGGSWLDYAWFGRSAYRFRFTPAFRYYALGLRVVCNEKKEEGWISAMMKFIRGGSWVRNARDCRSACHLKSTPTIRLSDIGLRIVCTKKEEGWFSAMMKYISGGSWSSFARSGRSANRSWLTPADRLGNISLRVASTQPLGNLVYIPAGRFMIGSPSTESGRYKNEDQREVVIDHPFWMMDAPVTRSLYHEVMGLEFDGKDTQHPMVDVSWHDSMEFCRRLSEITGHQFTLPTESQWEYACRAGTNTAYSFGDDPKELDDYGWHYGNCDGLQPVRQKKPNPWGLYDMHGLVWEWCLDGPEG